MRSSEDNADDEFVFVANKVVAARYFDNAVNFGPSGYATRSSRTHPRLNHLQPIPTTLDLTPMPVPKSLTTLPNTTTSKSKATPLPPELIELLPPHLRENTVPDYTGSSYSLSPMSKTSGEEELPERPPLPTAYCPGDYSNLEEPTTPTTSPTASSYCSSLHSYAHLSDIISSDGGSGLPASHGTRASSLTSSRPNSRNGSINAHHSASHTAPAALGLTDSGISSCSSSNSNSSNSSRSNSSRSLPREGSRTSLSGRPLQPPSPKFARNAASATSPQSTNSPGSNPCLSPPLTKVSYTAVLASDGERASMYRKLEALTPTPSPLLNNFRANSNPQATTSRTDLTSAAVQSRPHTEHVATSHTTLTAMGQCKSNVSHSSTPSHTPNHTPTPARKAKTSKNGVSSTAGADIHQCWNGIGIEGGGDGGGGGGGGGVSSCSASHQVLSSASSSRHASPIRSTPIVPTPVTPHSSSAVHSPMGQISDHRAKGWAASPPSSPEMRRAWNVVGVPMNHCISTPTKGRSPAPSPTPCTGYLSSSDPDSIYDNLVVRQPPLAPPVPRATPMASVPPTFTPVVHSSPSLVTQHQGSSSSTSSRRITQCPLIPGKPPSPSAQRRAASRSPTPTGAWGGHPGGGVGVGVVSPQYVPYYPPGDGTQYGRCWVPVWGSSPQLYQGEGSPLYPAYVYGGPPGAPPSAPPAGLICEGRSHSCDRFQGRPSPPSSPRNGRRSASPWRGGSASPQSHRHSPSPDPANGRPPRPRRPPARKSKTVEVGFLGVGTQPPASHHMPAGEGVAFVSAPPHAPLHSVSYVQGVPSQAPAVSNQVLLHHVGHHPMPGACQRYVNPKQSRVSNFEVIHEQIRNASLSEPTYVNSSPSPSMSSLSLSYHEDNRPLTNGAHDLVSPSLVSSTCYPSSESVHTTKQGQAEVSKPKVTYKYSLYKCMKNLLRPIQ